MDEENARDSRDKLKRRLKEAKRGANIDLKINSAALVLWYLSHTSHTPVSDVNALLMIDWCALVQTGGVSCL